MLYPSVLGLMDSCATVCEAALYAFEECSSARWRESNEGLIHSVFSSSRQHAQRAPLSQTVRRLQMGKGTF